jgi:hypothetical protein
LGNWELGLMWDWGLIEELGLIWEKKKLATDGEGM